MSAIEILHQRKPCILPRQKTLFTWDTTFTGERWSRSANTSDYHIDPWFTSDFTAGYTFKSFTVSVRCNNIFDTRYQIVQGYPMPGRNILAAIEYCF